MVIDTSAILAIALNEPEAEIFEQIIVHDPIRLISPATVLESAMVLETRLGEIGGTNLDLWLYKIKAEVIPVTTEHAEEARRAWRRYGKGRDAAGLNFGDCFSYALAQLSAQPLLFKGNDFSKTDVQPAYDLKANTIPGK